MKNEVSSTELEWINLLVGAGLAFSATLFAGTPAAAWNAAIVGSVTVYCSAVALYRYGAWTEWSNLTLGCWAVVAPFVLGFGSAPGPMWTHVLVGLWVATIAAIQLLGGRSEHARSSR